MLCTDISQLDKLITTGMPPVFKHSRIDLATDAIRLVKLLRGNESQPIRFEIFQTYLHQVEGVPYEALSYVWGTRLSAQPVWIEECLLQVTENLYEALVYLRRSDEDRLLWIDAICIDQSHNAVSSYASSIATDTLGVLGIIDRLSMSRLSLQIYPMSHKTNVMKWAIVKERGHQVGQMNLVYKNAHRVVIWLGASDFKINNLYDWMTSLDQQMITGGASLHALSAWKNQWDLLVHHQRKLTPPIEIKEGLRNLLQREWFSRMWVLQEAALARLAMVQCGRNEVSSRAFVVMPSLLDIKCNDGEQARLDILPGPLRTTSWWAGGSRQDLLMLLQKFGRSKTSDPHDVVYSLLGLCGDSNTTEILQPDYQISLQEMIQQSVAYFMRQTKDLSEHLPIRVLPQWGMEEFLSSLNDLPLRAFHWAMEYASDALLYDLLVCQVIKVDVERVQQFMRSTGPHGPPITIAIKSGNTPLFHVLMHIGGAGTSTPNAYAGNPLSIAVREGNMYAAYLLRGYGEVNSQTSDSDSHAALLTAAKKGGLALENFLSRARSPEAESGAHMGIFSGTFRGHIMLLTAAKQRDLAVVEWILNQSKDDMSFTEDYSVSQPSSSLFIQLSQDDHHFELLTRLKWRNPESLTELESALVSGFLVVIRKRLIFSHSAKTKQFVNLRRIHDMEALLADAGWFGFKTPLGAAAEIGDTRTVSLLLESGASANSRDCDERAATPIWTAASRGHLETVRLLIEKGADIEMTANEALIETTPLWVASSFGYDEIVKLLIEHGASIPKTLTMA